MRRATAIGLVTVLLAAAGTVAVWFAHPARVARYAGSSGTVRATVTVAGAAPESVTLRIDGVEITAHKLP